jgi:MFS family permease
MRSNVLSRLLGAQALSSFGTSVSTVALGIMVYQLTGSMLHMGGVMAVSAFPLIVTSWIGGALLDRFPAKWIMVGADGARAVLIFLMPFVAQAATGLIYVIACLVGMFSACFNPGQMKLTAELVRRDDLVKANSYLSMSRDGTEWIGYLAGGVLVYAVGYKIAFAIDAASYVASALLLLGLPRPRARTEPPAPVRELIARSPAVFMRMWRHPALRTNMLLVVFPAMAIMMGMPNSYGLVLKVFDAGALAVGVLEAAVAVGSIVGAVVISRMALKGDKNAYVLLSLVLIAACLVGVYFTGFLGLAIALMGVAGFMNVGMVIPSITMFQEAPAEGDKGRLLAVRGGFGQVGATIGFLVGGVLGDTLGIRRTFLVAGLAVIVMSVAIYLPYRIAASRRAAAAWDAALASGTTRAAARKAARQAASGEPEETWTLAGAADEANAWAMAAEEADAHWSTAAGAANGRAPANGRAAQNGATPSGAAPTDREDT